MSRYSYAGDFVNPADTQENGADEMIRKAVMFRNIVFTHPYWHIEAIWAAARTFGVSTEKLEEEWDPNTTHGYFNMDTGEYKPSGASPHPYFNMDTGEYKPSGASPHPYGKVVHS